jgi:hypothetical protein
MPQRDLKQMFTNTLGRMQSEPATEGEMGEAAMDLMDAMINKSRKPTEKQLAVAQQMGIVPDGDGGLIYKGFKLTNIGLIVTEQTTIEDWNWIGDHLIRLEGSVQWLIGDWVAYGETEWGKTYDQLEVETEYKYQTLRDYVYVAKNVDLSIRNRQMTFSHHRVIAGVKDTRLQKLWLDYAVHFKLKRVAAFKDEFMLLNANMNKLSDQERLTHYQYQRQTLTRCIQDGVLLSQIPPFKKQAKSKPKGDRLTFESFHKYVGNEIDNLPEMDEGQRARFFERIDWLIRYYEGLKGER